MAFNIGIGTKVKILENVKSPRAGQTGTVKAFHHGRYVVEFKDKKREDFVSHELDYDM